MITGPTVIFMLEHLKRNGCDVKPENIVCVPCLGVRSGGFSPGAGAVTMCQESLLHQQHMEDTLTHELIHMYDHCKLNVDWLNLRHHACSEVSSCPTVILDLFMNVWHYCCHQIRANSLSGDCKFTRELRRGFMSFSKQHQVRAGRGSLCLGDS